MDPASAIPLKVILATANPAATVGNANAVCVTVNQATSEPAQELRCLRPWGWYEVLAVGEGYQVKRLHLEPNQRFSLQLHHHRSEQWLVLNGQGVVQLGEDSLTVQLGQLLAVPVACVHRASAGPQGLEILEVQRGSVLREDDIERLEDDYGRCEPT
jgi:mannose-6-phosphate isomerase-like protein (cupin superfamily)